jgi:hypothetical protein
MVTIKDFQLQESREGKSFISLVLQGDIELVQSMETGRFYATARRCKISSTFDEETAKSLIGTKLPGRIERVACEEYEYTVPETGEVITLAHSYQFLPDDHPVGEHSSRTAMQESVEV